MRVKERREENKRSDDVEGEQRNDPEDKWGRRDDLRAGPPQISKMIKGRQNK